MSQMRQMPSGAFPDMPGAVSSNQRGKADYLDHSPQACDDADVEGVRPSGEPDAEVLGEPEQAGVRDRARRHQDDQHPAILICAAYVADTAAA